MGNNAKGLKETFQKAQKGGGTTSHWGEKNNYSRWDGIFMR
jgi:hypothetical protein